ncbi:alkaline phosphatase family protein [Luteimicrobium subarcticum]|uniref:DNA-binding beta-propeller fold protein YncE n=1 Tax=Luteimicrobium subarcticum TaxID=620910 RepID=A0A2M8WR59_9MICO|nr:alkaline phosphatase family protein [Luteimicrobium subarcticum]PJI93421.1 DNA-binding beta-propeller fold protein YncE [Luteimicrobium subarcticum]
MQVTRVRRVKPARSQHLRTTTARGVRIATAGTAAVALAGTTAAYATTESFRDHHVGTEYADGIQVSDDQVIKPIGDRLVTQTGKFMGSTVSPDGRYLAATSTDRSVALQIFDLADYKQIWSVGSAAGVNEKITDNTVGQEGPTYSPDGSVLWLPQSGGLTRFPVQPDGTLGAGTTVPIPKVDGHAALTGKSVYSPDGSTLYVAVNGQDRVVAIDPATGAILDSWAVGVAPRDLVLVGSTLYVSDEGGRDATDDDTTLTSYGADVVADPFLGTSTTGTLSLIDTAHPRDAVGSVKVGLHPTALYATRDAVFVANTNSSTVSVVSTRTHKVVQTIATQPWSGSSTGYSPTGIALTKDGRLLVTLGRANAVAVYRYWGNPLLPVSYVGLLPTDYYPSDVATVGSQVVVTNRRGIDARGPLLTFNEGQGTTAATGHGTHGTTASLTKFTLPTDLQVARGTSTVFAQNGWGKNDVQEARGASGRHTKAVPVPAKIGDPSTIKHVFLLVKENRTYDQVYGDMPQGDGDASLAQFGAKVTPNQHALATQFGLYDNTYDVGTNSAEGHNWLMQGDNPEYTESSAGEYTRSYDTEEDVLGHQSSGFLWTAVEKAGKTARDFGEFEYTEGKPAGATWQQYYCAATSVDAGGDPAQLFDPSIAWNNGSVIPSLDAISDHRSPSFDTSVPDIYRYQVWKQDFEKNGPANLNMMWLSSDHTGGTADPEAQVADGDLAVGKIVDTISHSPYWKDSLVVVVEDDSQAGADHVDGHRAPVQIISPWAQHGTTVSTYYSQISIVRTIEQILGARPLNQKVAAATPMFDAFTRHADTTPFDAVPNQVPLTEGVATTPSCGADTLGLTGGAATQLAAAQATKVAVPAAERQVAADWTAWSKQQHFTGNGAKADYANPELMNRYTWYQTHQWSTPYPGDAVIYTPNEVPGGYLPGADQD